MTFSPATFTRPFAAARRIALVALLATGIVTAITPAAQATQTATYGAQFAVHDIDPWDGTGVDHANQAYAVNWNQDGFSSDLQDWAGMKFGGSIGGATSGTLGVDFGYDASHGTLDINYPASVDVTYPDDETYFPGDTIRISTVNHSAAGSFDFAPGAQDYSVTGKLALAAHASGELCFVDCFGTIPFFPAFNVPEQSISLLHAHADTGQYGDIWNPPTGAGATHVSGDVNISRPDMSLDIAQQERMQAVSSAPFMQADVDVDAFSNTSFGRSFDSNGMALSYDVLDGRVNLHGEETHTFDFRPTVRVTLAFPRSLSFRVVTTGGVAGELQTGTSATIDAGQSIDLVLPRDLTQQFAITPTMTLTNTLRHALDHEYHVAGTIKILHASAGIPGFTVIPGFCVPLIGCTPALEFPGLNVGIGPVYQTSIPITSTTAHLFDRTWSVPFTPAAQTPRGFDPENIPVAIAGGPYDFNEGSSGKLDGTASYDLDNDDVITYAWKLDSPGSLEATGATPTFAALDGDHTYTATLTVCDLKHNCNAATTLVRVHNVAPSHRLDVASAIDFGVGPAFLTRKGVPVPHAATALDLGTDDTTYTWAGGQFATWKPQTTTYFNNGATPDPKPSPFGTLPFVTSTSSTVTFSQPGVATLTLVVSDDDGGSTTTNVPVLIADDSTTVRPYGWFKQQYSLAGNRELTATQLDAYLAFTRSASRVFDEQVPLRTSADAYATLQRLDEATTTTAEQARAFTLTAWLNVASGAIAFDKPLPKQVQKPGRMTTADALREIERVLLDPMATKPQLLDAMQLAKSIG